MRENFAVIGASLVGYWTLMSFMSVYKEGAFDFREMSRERWTLSFFFSGLLAAGISLELHLLMMIVGAITPLIALQLFRLFRFPASKVVFLPRKFKWILVGLSSVLFFASIFDRLILR